MLHLYPPLRIARMDPFAYVTDEEAKSYDKCYDALSGTCPDLAIAQGLDKCGTSEIFCINPRRPPPCCLSTFEDPPPYPPKVDNLPVYF